MNAITIVLRSGMGMQLDAIRPYLKPGIPIAIGRAGAVIAEVAEGNAIEDKRQAAEAAAGYIDSVERYVESASALEGVVTVLESTLQSIEQYAENGQSEPWEALRHIRELAAAFLDNSGARAQRASPASGAAAEPAYPGAAAARRLVDPIKPGIFDVITGTACVTGDGSGAQLPPLEEHLAQVEQVAAGLREDQADLAESLQVLQDWLERVEVEDGYVGVPVAVEVVVTELKRQQQAIHPVACRYDHWFAGDSEEASFIREHGVCRACADVDEQLTGQVLLKPCSFCGGPPKPIVTHADHPFGAAARMDNYGDDGLWIEACVFCHECGAQGPALQRDIFDASDYDSALEAAVNLWQNRDERNAELYQAGHAEGLNLFPRPDIEPAPQVLCAGVDVATDRVDVAIHHWTTPAEGGDA